MTPVIHVAHATHDTLQCSYEDAYLPIYETSYDVSFIFCDEEDVSCTNDPQEAEA